MSWTGCWPPLLATTDVDGWQTARRPGASVPELRWLAAADEDVYRAVYRVVSAVMAGGGAVGWLGVPTYPETVAWLDGILAAAVAGQARLLTVLDGARTQALGRGVWDERPTVSVNAAGQQVKRQPAAR